MTLTYRPLEDRDAVTICGFVQSAEELFFAFPKATFPLTPDALIAGARQRFSPTVVLQDDAVVGYANFINVKEDRGGCTLGNLMVHPDHRRAGVATFLVKKMMHIAFETYCARFIRAACFSHNQAAYQMYHRLGFKPGEMEQRVTSDSTPVLLVNLYFHRGKGGDGHKR
jgi:ribosomal protein S18 acetylase RimI-like enzyme